MIDIAEHINRKCNHHRNGDRHLPQEHPQRDTAGTPRPVDEFGKEAERDRIIQPDANPHQEAEKQ